MNLPARITVRLRDEYGLDESVFRGATLETVVRSRMNATGIDGVEEYFRHLGRSKEEFLTFSEKLLVPESWFFRDGKPFAWLAEWAKTEWEPAHPGEVLRILSVPCAIGQEPYSIAMSLLAAGMPADRFHIEAGDLCNRFLEQAMHGEYRPIAFRSGIPADYESFFEELEDGKRRVVESVRKQVSFRQHNLLASDFLLGEKPFHAIFCRNVLIYFSSCSRERAINQLLRSLAPDGLVFGGHADALGSISQELGPVGPAGSFCFGRRAAPVEPSPPPSIAQIRPSSIRSRPRPKPAKNANSSEKAPPSISERWQRVRELADNGDLPAAESLCQELIQQLPPSAEAFNTLGEILAAQRRSNDAEQAFRRAIYLDAQHAQSLFHLALISESRGDAAGAQRFRRRARDAEARKEVST
ncbi:MAG: CheR family methyltransferase [Verrucomicrobiota bacterium]